MKTWSLGSALCCCLVIAACGGDNEKSSGDNGNTGGVVTVRSGDRIAWDQPVESPETARAYTYTLYVDGAKMSMSEVSCAEVRTAGGVACSGRLPAISGGRHSLEVTASFGSFESGRSTALSVSMASVAFVTASVPDAGAASSSSESTVTCAPSSREECYETNVVASGLGAITSLVASRNIAFVVEDHARIRAIVNDVLTAQPALSADAGTRILDLVISPDFDRTRVVYVSRSEPSTNGGEALQVTRYRELQGVFGEGATVIAGLPLPVGGFAPMAIDESGLIYLALPAMGVGGVSSAADLSHFVLRFQSDGTVPAQNSVASPVIAQGYGQPSAIQWSQGAKELWLSGSDDRSLAAVSTLKVVGATDWPMQPAPAASALRALPEVSSLAVTQDAQSGSLVWVVSQGAVLRMPVGTTNSLRLEAVALPGNPKVTRVTAGADGALFIAIQLRPGQSSEVWRYRRVAARSGM